MNIHYKIKVGIEEYSVDEKDIPRIVQAMKSNDMVKLDCGIFRGQAILAVARDLEKEERERLLETYKKSPEQVEQDKKAGIIKQQMDECKECTGSKGWRFKIVNGEKVAYQCSCTYAK